MQNIVFTYYDIEIFGIVIHEDNFDYDKWNHEPETKPGWVQIAQAGNILRGWQYFNFIYIS